jgi:hypothetical protein
MANPKHQRTTFQELCGLLVAPDAPPNHPMRQLGEELDKLTAFQSGGSSTTVNNSISNTTVTGSGGTTTAPDEELSPVLTGANVKGGTVLYFSGGACGAACSSNVDRAADAVCVRIVQASGLRAVYKHSGPMVVSLATGQTTLTRGNKLYLSASEPGTLTADANEEAALFHQQCGWFLSYTPSPDGSFTYRLANVSVGIIPPASLPEPGI